MEASQPHSPASLLSMTIKFVASHLDLVESFCGLPSLIGEQIIKIALQNDRYKYDFEYSYQSNKLFAEAFKEDVLCSLNVSGHHLGLNFYLEQILLFVHLEKLDVSGCGLGDDHELLSHFAKLYRLKILIMRNNFISNVGIQKMTTPFRMFGKGPTCLCYADLSGNKNVTKECLKYLTMFENLSIVVLPDIQTHAMNGIWSYTKAAASLPLDIQTCGYVSGIISEWMTLSESKARQKKKTPSRFYSKHKNLEDKLLEGQVKSMWVVIAHRRRVSSNKNSTTKMQPNDEMNSIIFHGIDLQKGQQKRKRNDPEELEKDADDMDKFIDIYDHVTCTPIKDSSMMERLTDCDHKDDVNSNITCKPSKKYLNVGNHKLQQLQMNLVERKISGIHNINPFKISKVTNGAQCWEKDISLQKRTVNGQDSNYQN